MTPSPRTKCQDTQGTEKRKKENKKVSVLTQAPTLASGCKEDPNLQGEPKGLWISLLK
jgi:hypothetical protein